MHATGKQATFILRAKDPYTVQDSTLRVARPPPPSTATFGSTRRGVSPSLPLPLADMASLAGLSVPSDKAEFLDLDALVRALDDWAVKGKFSFRTEKREATKASFICAEKEDGCSWRCRATPTFYDDDKEPSL
ncbi:hypothetical protein VC83_02144 [Pseudogymnoascus destructans]|uniref:Transposase MuDR plant domain-containing protein n=1 Tax=Pseudogymnoascus destructans TaxID=655981 RepID=A0A177AJI3_9PEZI|nr:uncharacterized protein VC83_02144 [Pseudogymnoascus destructans]OAF61453.1 hypothetical protein VC83_02144 [Pseudogymnoascus destructans]